jgi:hypothetical protein
VTVIGLLVCRHERGWLSLCRHHDQRVPAVP